MNKAEDDKLKGLCPHGNHPNSCETCLAENNEWLKEIVEAQPEFIWTIETPDKHYGLVVKLPHQCVISGTLNIEDKSMKIDMFMVNERLRGKGVGAKLLTELAKQAKEYEAKILFGHVTSKSALVTRAKVFGQVNLRFYSPHSGEKIEKSFEEIMSEKSNLIEGNLDYLVAVELK